MAALGTGFSSSFPAKQCRTMTNLSASPTAQPMSGCTQCLPRAPVTSAEGGSLCASEHSWGTAKVCARQESGQQNSVAAGSACTSHTHTPLQGLILYMSVIPPHAAPPATATHPKELPAGGWRSKPTPCLESHIRHQRHSHSRTGFCEPFINPVHSFGARNYSVSSLLSHSSQGLIINGPVKQYTACCILIQ